MDSSQTKICEKLGPAHTLQAWVGMITSLTSHLQIALCVRHTGANESTVKGTGTI